MDAKYNKKFMISASMMLFTFMIAFDWILSLPGIMSFKPLFAVVLMAYSMITYILLFHNTILEKIIWWCIFYFGIAIMELITFCILKLVLNKSLDEMSTDELSLHIIIIGKVLFVLLFEFIIRSRKSKLIISFIYLKDLAFIILFNIILLLAVIYMFSNHKSILFRIDQVISFVFAMVLIITVYTVLLIFRVGKKSKEELETQLKLQQIELELKLNDDMILVTDKLRKLRHDMNNHIGLIKALVTTQKYDELEEYINQIYEDVEIANDLVITGNKTLSVLLNSKKCLAKSKNIDFTSMIVAQDINMQNKDICILLGNILDNAIEAAEKSGDNKYVQLMIQKTEEGCIIKCENSFGIRPVMKKGKFITIKDNTLIHGIGTENIMDIVTKYKGEINFDYEDEIFSVKVVMPV